jgi:hypothetical protein
MLSGPHQHDERTQLPTRPRCAVCRIEPPLNETVPDYIEDGSVVYTRWNKSFADYSAEGARDPK